MSRVSTTRRIIVSASLVGAGAVVQLASFGWVHPMAFLSFALVGGSLSVAGIAWFVVSTRGRERASQGARQ